MAAKSTSPGGDRNMTAFIKSVARDRKGLDAFDILFILALVFAGTSPLLMR
jgi:hypothetical protein